MALITLKYAFGTVFGDGSFRSARSQFRGSHMIVLKSYIQVLTATQTRPIFTKLTCRLRRAFVFSTNTLMFLRHEKGGRFLSLGTRPRSLHALFYYYYLNIKRTFAPKQTCKGTVRPIDRNNKLLCSIVIYNFLWALKCQ